MLLSDPSEAAHSDEILNELEKVFECKELPNLGGTVLQLLFDDIAHHFLDDSTETLALVEACIKHEQELITKGAIPSDFVFGVFQLRGE